MTWSLGESVDEDDIPEAVNIEVELQRFRSQWQRELCGQGEPRKQGEVGEPRKQGEVGEACSKQASGVEQKDRNENPVSEPTGGNTREPTVEEQVSYWGAALVMEELVSTGGNSSDGRAGEYWG